MRFPASDSECRHFAEGEAPLDAGVSRPAGGLLGTRLGKWAFSRLSSYVHRVEDGRAWVSNQWVHGRRGSGKTARLIVESNRLWAPIVTANHVTASLVEIMAREMGVAIPSPLPMSRMERLRGLPFHGVLVDDARYILENQLRVPVAMAVADERSEERGRYE